MTPEFKPFPKISRWANSKIAIAEKIDGTNGVISIGKFAGCPEDSAVDPTILCAIGVMSTFSPETGYSESWVLRAGSRNRWLTRAADNYGFAKWVQENDRELMMLGEGMHYGEWFGSGIQHGYGLPNGDKRFALFNTGRWVYMSAGVYDKNSVDHTKTPVVVNGLTVVPQLYYGPARDAGGNCMIEQTAKRLQFGGSEAVRGYDNPEGVMVYFEAMKQYAKVPFDPSPKGQI